MVRSTMSSTSIASLVAVALVLFVQSAQAQDSSTCVKDYAPGTDYFPDGYKTDPFVLPIDQVIVTSAQLFNVYYNLSYKVVRDNSANTLYLLHQCGTPIPELSLPTKTAVKSFEVPLKAVAVDSSVPAPYLQLLGLNSMVQRADLSYAMSPCLKLLESQGKIQTFDAYNLTNGALLAQGLSGVLSAANLPTSPLPANYISFGYSTADKGPLERVEWIKYMGAFFNAEALASKVYASISENYKCLSAAYKSYPSTKTVVWATREGTEWVLYDKDYKLQFISDAGGKNLVKTLLRRYNTSVASDLDALRGALAQVDVLIDETYILGDLTAYNYNTFQSNLLYNPALSSYPFITNQAVYRVDRRVGPSPNYAYDWYEMALVEPQVVLSEIAAMIHPEVTVAPKYLRNLAKGEPLQIVTPFECVDPVAATAVAIVPCPSIVATPAAPPPAKAAASNTRHFWSLGMTAVIMILTVLAY